MTQEQWNSKRLTEAAPQSSREVGSKALWEANEPMNTPFYCAGELKCNMKFSTVKQFRVVPAFSWVIFESE